MGNKPTINNRLDLKRVHNVVKQRVFNSVRPLYQCSINYMYHLHPR